MATMVKEKRREKKKPKEKHETKSNIVDEHAAFSKENEVSERYDSTCTVHQKSAEFTTATVSQATHDKISLEPKPITETGDNIAEDLHTSQTEPVIDSTANVMKTTEKKSSIQEQVVVPTTNTQHHDSQSLLVTTPKASQAFDNAYEELNTMLDILTIPCVDSNRDTSQIEHRLLSPQAYLENTEECKIENTTETLENISEQNLSISMQEKSLVKLNVDVLAESTTPSAPVFEEEIIQTEYHQREHISPAMKAATRPQCMPLEEAIRIFGGKEMEEIRLMSEREEALVEAGPVSGPEHPLVDLLSTFRSSLRAVDRERTQLTSGYIEEEKLRTTLWKIEKRTFSVSEKCKCDANVYLKGVYEHAEFQQERLPAARLRLEGLLRRLQDSYCHHQHAALLAYCQIEELISETCRSSKGAIRAAIALVLAALQTAGSGPEALCAALQRWAHALAAAVMDHRDCRQLLYLLHHLFRQTRSIRWAAKVTRFSVSDLGSAARGLALLELMLGGPRLEAGRECTEEEVWEEVDESGTGSAVSDGSVRERDLIALVRASPLRGIVAAVCRLPHADVRVARPEDWHVSSAGMVQSCCAARALLAVVARATSARPHYRRLRRLLTRLALHTLHCLAGLHVHCRSTYSPEYREKISAELEACFSAAVSLLDPGDVYRVPASLLDEEAARDYCGAIMARLHETNPAPYPRLSFPPPTLQCGDAVKTVAWAALDRTCDHELARTVLEFLMQTGIKRPSATCSGSCVVAARQTLPRVIAAHPHLHTTALHILADLYQAEALDPSALEPLSASRWRPSCGEVRAVLDDWVQRCKPMLQHLLLALDYTPHCGVSLESQLTIGSWLCEHSHPDAPQWAWLVLYRLSVHRAAWGLPLDAPAPEPEPEPEDLFGGAYAVLATSWGHCVPLICSRGVAALCRLATARPRAAAHCLSPVMAAMAQSPESLSYTPHFFELVATICRSGPTAVQRAFGRGPPPGTELLLQALLPPLEGASFPGVPLQSLVSSCLHLLWPLPLHGALSPPVLDTAMLACRLWTTLDAHTALLLQQPSAKEQLSSAVRAAAAAPLLCESLLRAHAQCEARGLTVQLLDALQRQRVAGERIHVDNALKQIGARMTSDELVIHRTAIAVLSAPLDHPSHLTLWRLLLHLYLQRPPSSMLESTPPVGPLFFSGLVKSRVLTQLRARLAETAKYHRNEIETLQTRNTSESQGQGSSASATTPSTNATSQPEADNEDILPVLKIGDLTGESSDTSDVESSSEGESEGDSEMKEVDHSQGESKTDVQQMIGYHSGAEKMMLEFGRWLEAGDKARAMSHHADIARFIPEPAMTAAWNSALGSRRPPPPPTPPPARPPRAPLSPLQSTVRHLMRIKEQPTRTRKPTIESRTDNINFKDSRQILKTVDQHLAEIERLSAEWSSEVSRVATLDGQLWPLVAALRVEQPLPPVKKACSNGCKPITIVVPVCEWCISPGASHGVSANRRAAREAARRVARPRHAAAGSAATLQAIARQVRDVETARAVVQRAMQSAARAGGCAPAEEALMALVGTVAERWLCPDASLCAELISRWCRGGSTPLQQTLAGALIQPRGLRDWPLLYCAVLNATLPANTMFSYLSKFEVSRWSPALEAAPRRQLLEALLEAAQRWGPEPEDHHLMLLELFGVHTRCLLNSTELSAHTMRCTDAALKLGLPPAHWPHIVAAVDDHARDVPFDQLGHLLRSLGARWWEARSLPAPQRYAAHGPPVAALLHALMRAFTAAAVAMSYAPERVSWYAWSALQESWGPWVCPHGTLPPLLPSTGDEPERYTTVVQLFVRCIQQLMVDCPGTEDYLLQHIYEWTIQTFMTVNAASSSQEGRVQMSALMAELAGLPWSSHQWGRLQSLQLTAQICSCGDKEILSWCSATWRHIRADCWLRGVEDGHIVSALDTIFYVFTSMPVHEETLREAAQLPWRCYPEQALAPSLERYFAAYHNPTLPYHDLPHFSVVLSAAELTPRAPSPTARPKRAVAVSLWSRAAVSPPLHQHVPPYCQRILDVITNLAPHIEASEGEIEELQSRAMIVMNIEPAAASALPEWQRWTSRAPCRLLAATLTAAAQLTTLPYFGAIAEHTISAYLNCTESCGWSEVLARWSSCHWREMAPLVSSARLHAAYGVCRTHAQTADQWRAGFVGIMAANINFIENEGIISLWICVACRVGYGCTDSGAEAECREAARALLRRWAEEPRRSLLRVFTDDTATSTANHRLLSRLALCIFSSTNDSVRAYEAACAAVLGSSPGDVLTWGKQPHPKRLVRLAMRLFPNCDQYFKDELELAPDDS